MQNPRSLLSIALFLVLLLVLWAGLTLLPAPETVRLPEDAPGYRDLSGLDFSDTVYYVKRGWDSLPGALYTPEDFADGVVAAPSVPSTSVDYAGVQYITHRQVLKLVPGRTYGLSMGVGDFSMRIFLDDAELDSIGVPGDTPERTVPRVDERTYYFTPRQEETTLLVQMANFVHREGVYPPNFTIGADTSITRLAQKHLIQSILVLGVLLAACLYYLALYLLNQRNRGSLVFSVCCALLALMNRQLIPLFWPEYNWHLAFQLEYLVHFATFGMCVLLVDSLFPGLLHRRVTRPYWVLCGLYALSTFVLDTRVYSALLLGFEVVSIAMMAYVLARLLLSLRQRRVQNLLGFVGVAVLAFFALNDILYHNNIVMLGRLAGQLFTAPVGMVFFTFCYALIVSMDFAEHERRLAEALGMAEERYAVLEARLRAEAEARAEARPQPLEDFPLTPRERQIALLLLAGHTREEIMTLLGISRGTVNTLCSRLYRKLEVNSSTELILRFSGRAAEN